MRLVDNLMKSKKEDKHMRVWIEASSFLEPLSSVSWSYQELIASYRRQIVVLEIIFDGKSLANRLYMPLWKITRQNNNCNVCLFSMRLILEEKKEVLSGCWKCFVTHYLTYESCCIPRWYHVSSSSEPLAVWFTGDWKFTLCENSFYYDRLKVCLEFLWAAPAPTRSAHLYCSFMATVMV